jgi:uncharacterized membrane protein affecting hemolysin expression
VIRFINKKTPVNGIRRQLLGRALLFCLAAGLLFLPGSWFYLSWLGQNQSDQLGQLLVTQVADKSRRPLLSGDIISLQVIVNDVVSNNPLAVRAAVYDGMDNLQAQSGDDSIYKDYAVRPYRQPIILENSIAGHVQLSIDSRKVSQGFNRLFWVLFFAWLILSCALCTGIDLVGKRLSRRLLHIISGLPAYSSSGEVTPADSLPTDSAPTERDEISRLESSIKPLLVKPQITVKNDQDKSSFTLTMGVENIESLQAQLTRKNLSAVLIRFDLILDITATLFDAKRLPGSQNHVHFSFDCEGDKNNALIRALCFNISVNKLLILNEPTGAGISLGSVLGSGPSETLAESEKCQFSQDRHHELTLLKLAKTTLLAGPGQLLIEASLLEGESNLPFDYQVLENAPDLVLFLSLNEEYQISLSAQLSYLNSQLLELGDSSISEAAF